MLFAGAQQWFTANGFQQVQRRVRAVKFAAPPADFSRITPLNLFVFECLQQEMNYSLYPYCRLEPCPRLGQSPPRSALRRIFLLPEASVRILSAGDAAAHPARTDWEKGTERVAR